MQSTMEEDTGVAEKHYLIGSAGKENIKRLMSSKGSRVAIMEFGEQNCLDIPAASSIYGLLDSLGYTRLEIHAAALDSVVAAAKKQIQGTPRSQDQHLALLAQLRPYFRIPRLRHLPLMLLAEKP
ncbi:hypothetical protein GGH92_010097, partial [Coemansia sp. RSA 2673]